MELSKKWNNCKVKLVNSRVECWENYPKCVFGEYRRHFHDELSADDEEITVEARGIDVENLKFLPA